MGRVARYKKEKKVFDVRELFTTRREDQDEDPTTKTSNKGEKRKLLVKYDAQGNPVDGQAKRPRKQSNKKEGEFKLEGKKPGESFTEFRIRTEKETAEELRRQSKKKSRVEEKKKNYFKAKKAKQNEKKNKFHRKGKNGDDEDDIGEKERQVYHSKSDEPRGLYDVADAPPEIKTKLKGMETGLDDRNRFAKLTMATTSVPQTDISGKTGYEQLQMESLRLRVMNRYNQIREDRLAKRNGK